MDRTCMNENDVLPSKASADVFGEAEYVINQQNGKRIDQKEEVKNYSSQRLAKAVSSSLSQECMVIFNEKQAMKLCTIEKKKYGMHGLMDPFKPIKEGDKRIF